ncbi:hypothetical protein [Acidithiobacillus ferriphilus]|uniref:hypothetical protein n=1 Tax=Acidithiobacillus ferriphilus TaxID=1689834 RepID=UPI002DBD959E|nr:hypothetical protein [Acidithiobacillus ferriphilus]MEB8535117.1 hypothetical protein [Acidithiobacillus ferriphilus]
MRKNQKYLVSSGDTDDEYGLFVMEADEAKHEKEMYLAYFFDADRFTHIKREELRLFVSPENLNSCTDEFGNEYTGKSLEARIKEAIKAFNEELPGWKRHIEESKDWFKDDE